MLKEFAQYLVGLKDNNTYEIHGEVYSDNKLVRVPPYVPRPEKITVNGLDSIVQLIREEGCGCCPKLFVQVVSPRVVEVYSALDDDMERNCLYRAVCDAPEFKAGWRGYNSAIIELRSMFRQNEGTEYLLDLLSRITKENGVTTMDNGVTQQVEARSGISLKTMENIKPRVLLAPFRTFSEVEQPESEFLTRLDDDGNIGFFEADGGVWRLSAKERIAEFIAGNLTNVENSVIVMR